MENCLFCKILSGDLEGTIVFEDEICTAFMDIQPINSGHLLVVPNEHFDGLTDLPLETGKHIFAVAQKLASAIRGSGIRCEGINLFLADGKAAMQEVFHSHLHVIPRFEGDGFGFQFGPRYAELPTRDELEKDAYYIKQAIVADCSFVSIQIQYILLIVLSKFMGNKNNLLISAILVSVFYVAAQILADVASLRIVMVAGFSIDAGTFIYPLTFTLRDMVHKVAGVKATRILIFAAAGINIIMALFFRLVSHLPPDLSVGPQAEFALVLSPIWRIVGASIVAEVISELIDTEGYQFWVEKVTHKYQWVRVLFSNAISIPVDSFLFSFLAFWGNFPGPVVISIFLSNMIIKGLTTLVSIPGIYLVPDNNS